MELKDLYQEIILDHGKNPRNFGKCKNYTSDAKGHNPLCGDKVHIYAQLDKNKKILDPDNAFKFKNLLMKDWTDKSNQKKGFLW